MTARSEYSVEAWYGRWPPSKLPHHETLRVWIRSPACFSPLLFLRTVHTSHALDLLRVILTSRPPWGRSIALRRIAYQSP
jgi:hypothetical protein